MDTSHSSEVRPANTLAARAAKVRQMHKEHIRTTLEQARDIGAELRAAKEQCVREGKPWLPWLDEAKMNHRTGQQYMRIAEHWSLLVDHTHFAAHGGVTEAINYLAGAVEEEKEIGTRPRSTNPAAGMAPPPPQAAVKCVNCRRKGASGLNCEECKRLNSAPTRRRAEPAALPPEREPGDDDGEVDAEQDYDLKRLDKAMKPMWKEYAKVGALYGLKVGPTVNECDPLLQPAIRAFGEAKEKLRIAVLRIRKRAHETQQELPE